MTRSNHMNKGLSLLGGVVLGTGLMYFGDPVMGRRRRATLRDQFASACSQIDDCLATVWTDLSQRTQGVVAETSALFQTDMVSDDILAERVRSKVGRYVLHPAS